MATIAYAPWNGILVVVFGSRPAEPADWPPYLEVLRREVGARYKQRGLVVTDGGTMDNAQRKDVDDIIGPAREHDRRIAVVTRSTFARGFVRALSLLDPSYRAFSPDELAAAFSYVDAPRARLDDGIRLIAELRAKLSSEPR